jgi:hypothetical protein
MQMRLSGIAGCRQIKQQNAGTKNDTYPVHRPFTGFPFPRLYLPYEMAGHTVFNLYSDFVGHALL